MIVFQKLENLEKKTYSFLPKRRTVVISWSEVKEFLGISPSEI